MEVAISDTGPGINPVIREKIFEPFYTTKAIGEGSGMGLSIIHGIVHEHGGHILVDSAPNQGSTIRTLWLADKAGQGNDDPNKEREFEKSTFPTLRVLVVDDENAIACYLQDLLEQQGFEVITMTNSLDAVAYCIKMTGEIDLVITDLTMPKMNGKELAHALLKKHIDIPVIIMSGFPQNLTKDEMRAQGIHGYIDKPVDVDDLLAMIQSAIGSPLNKFANASHFELSRDLQS